MRSSVLWVGVASLAALAAALGCPAGHAETLDQYYAHRRAEDALGVIAPWHPGPNGPCDLRIRLAAECMKRYPWATKEKAVLAAPHFIYNTHWKIDADGTIRPVHAVPSLHLRGRLERLAEVGERIWNMERQYNLAAGLTAKDDDLPKRLKTEPAKTGPAKGMVSGIDKMIPEYYKVRGWTTEGVPTKDTMKRLGL